MRLIRQGSFVEAPWKNGGGITREAIRVPAGPRPFHWRLSLAEIEMSGAFSDFAGYRRYMALLRGVGLRLVFPGGRVTLLSTIGDLVEFDGAPPPFCELQGGPCLDLNLMVRSTLRAAAWVAEVLEPRVSPGFWDTVLVMPLRGSIDVLDGDHGATLSPWDLAVLEPRGGLWSVAQAAASGASTAASAPTAASVPTAASGPSTAASGSATAASGPSIAGSTLPASSSAMTAAAPSLVFFATLDDNPVSESLR